jgi:hypothetical protein
VLAEQIEMKKRMQEEAKKREEAADRLEEQRLKRERDELAVQSRKELEDKKQQHEGIDGFVIADIRSTNRAMAEAKNNAQSKPRQKLSQPQPQRAEGQANRDEESQPPGNEESMPHEGPGATPMKPTPLKSKVSLAHTPTNEDPTVANLTGTLNAKLEGQFQDMRKELEQQQQELMAALGKTKDEMQEMQKQKVQAEKQLAEDKMEMTQRQKAEEQYQEQLLRALEKRYDERPPQRSVAGRGQVRSELRDYEKLFMSNVAMMSQGHTFPSAKDDGNKGDSRLLPFSHHSFHSIIL